MKRLLVLAIVVCAAVGAAACSERTRPALNLDGNRLTIYNDTDETWSNVEVILNQHFHIQPSDIPPDGIVQAPLDIFVAGYGQRFNFKTMQITDLRLKAKRPNGEPIELRYEFRNGGLQDALGGFKGKS
jgi:hypothetical protein